VRAAIGVRAVDLPILSPDCRAPADDLARKSKMHRLFLATAAATLLVAGPSAAASVEFRELVARVTVIPEARDDIQVEVLSHNRALPILVRTEHGKVLVDGDLARRIRGCNMEGGRPVIKIAGIGDVPWAQLPQLVVRTPKYVEIFAGGAVFGSIGRSTGLDLAQAGCGDWVVGNVDGPLRLSLAGSGDVRVGASRSARLRVTGSGDIYAGSVGGIIDAEVGGSGDISAVSVADELKVQIAGSGDVKVQGGQVPVMKVSIAGSGDVDFGGVAESLKARITGSGEIRVHSVTGTVERRVLGSGGVRIGGQKAGEGRKRP
jgi:hypothetical protein